MGRILILFLLVSAKLFASNDTIPHSIIPVKDPVPAVRFTCRASIFPSQFLCIVDGVPSDTSYLNTLNLNNLVGIEIIKPSVATALYGIKGLNGAMLITTKKTKQLTVQDAEDGTLLEGATIKILPLNEFLVTDRNGRVDLSQVDDNRHFELEVSCIGYKTKTAAVTTMRNSDLVQLEKNFSPLDTVVLKSTLCTKKTRCGYDVSPTVLACPISGVTITSFNEEKTQLFASNTFSVYPNPASRSETITIQLPQSVEGKIDLVNSAGQVMQTISANTNKSLYSVRLNNANAGFYLIQVTDSKSRKSFTQKLIVQ